jgi:hypothetical protein
MNDLRILRYNQVHHEDYAIDSAGFVWSKKKGSWKRLNVTFNVNDPKRYPMVKLTIDGKRVSVMIHRVICETFNPLPVMARIESIFGKDMKLFLYETPGPIQSGIIRYFNNPEHWQVNHIDQDKANFHPSNLEWLPSSRENIDKHTEFRKNNILLTAPLSYNKPVFSIGD